MTKEQVQKDYNRLIAKNGFTFAGYTSDTGNPIYHRIWQMQEDKLEVRILLSGTYPLVTIKRNGTIDGDIIYDFANPKTAMSTIRTIVRDAGYEM